MNQKKVPREFLLHKIVELEKEIFEKDLIGTKLLRDNEELEKELERINNISEQRKHIEAKYELAIKEVERLKEENKRLHGFHNTTELKKENEELENKVDDFEEKIHKITNWIKAYPLKIFPSMSIDDWKSVRDILSSNGYTIDRISADNMRHVLNGIHKILSEEGEVK